jgi:hypothetical protein
LPCPSRHLCEHLKHAPKQITSRSSQFLDTCLKFNNGEITHAQLIEATVRLGFNNVIDAFHNVNQGEIEKRFFIDERKTNNGIRLTDNFFSLGERLQYKNLAFETNARWNLVEQAWAMGFPVILWASSSTKESAAVHKGERASRGYHQLPRQPERIPERTLFLLFQANQPGAGRS